MLTDAEKLKAIMTALRVKGPEFSKKLKYSSPTTIYNIFKGIHGISNDMITRILSAYPEVSYIYLKKGEGLPIIKNPSMINQKNILQYRNFKEITLYDLINMVNELESLKNEIIDLKQDISSLKKEIKKQ